jgi:serine/threonine protein kinase
MNKIKYNNLKNFIKLLNPRILRRGKVHIDEWFEGRYQIDSILGYGHTSIVFKVVDTRLERYVALKFWHNLANGVNSSILLREGRLLAQLAHSNIVRVLDYGIEPETEYPWTVLEYLGDITLYDVIKKRNGMAPDWKRITNIVLQISSIISYLHDSIDLVQLDIKPGNFAIDTKTDVVKIMDLGSAYYSDSENIKRLGSPGYIAPELFTKLPFTKKADAFSIGMLIYELITGRNPLLEIQKTALNSRGIKSNYTESAKSNYDTRAIPIPLSDEIICSTDPIGCTSKTGYKLLQNKMKDVDLAISLTNLKTPEYLIKLIISLCSFEISKRPSVSSIQSIIEKNEMISKPTPSLFISHAHKDKVRFVNSFVNYLRAEGYLVWLDEKSIRAGEPFWDKITTAIEESDYVILILSENSLRSRAVNEEIRTAQLFNLNNTKIIPIRIDPIDFSEIPPYIRSRHVLDFVGWEDSMVFNTKISKLIADINFHHGDSAA